MSTDSHAASPLIVVMGVSGSGKSTIAARLAERLGVRFIDGDDLHPAHNIEKMSLGFALDDADRLPWLADVGRSLRDHAGSGVIVACSALRRRYRDVIRWEAPNVVFLHAHGDQALLLSRLNARVGHFMPPTLLASQLKALEPLDESEAGFIIDIQQTVEEIISSTTAKLHFEEGSTWATRTA